MSESKPHLSPALGGVPLSQMSRHSLEDFAEDALNRIVELEEQYEDLRRYREDTDGALDRAQEEVRGLKEQLEDLREAAELIVPSGKFTLIGPYEYVRADDLIALRDALRLGESNPATEPKPPPNFGSGPEYSRARRYPDG